MVTFPHINRCDDYRCGYKYRDLDDYRWHCQEYHRVRCPKCRRIDDAFSDHIRKNDCNYCIACDSGRSELAHTCNMNLDG